MGALLHTICFFAGSSAKEGRARGKVCQGRQGQDLGRGPERRVWLAGCGGCCLLVCCRARRYMHHSDHRCAACLS